MITVYAVTSGEAVLALFRNEREARRYASVSPSREVMPWSIPAETMEFEE
jgi:hypothetical protein